MKRSTPFIDLIFITGSALFFFFTFLGNIHLFDWDEINFAECAREMIVSGDYWHVQIDFKPFHEKPPFFIWLQVLSMKCWGINEYAARFPNALCGLITLLTIYRIGYKHFHRSFAMLWVLCYMGSILPHLYFKSGIIDPWFNYFIFLSLYFLYRYFNTPIIKHILLAGLFCGLAVFTKGPVAYLLLLLSLLIYQIIHFINHRSVSLAIIQHIPAFLIFTLLSFSFLLIWYLVDICQHGPSLFYEFIEYQIRLFKTEDAGHGGFPGYHIIVLLFGCFPASFIALYVFKLKSRYTYTTHNFARLLLILGIVVLVVFSLVQSKIVHYSSLCYYPISFFAAVTLAQTIRSKSTLPKSLIYCIIIFFTLLLSVLIAVPYIPVERIQELLKNDPFASANLEAILIWSPISLYLSIFYLLLVFALIPLFRSIRYQRLSFVGMFGITIAILHLFFWFYLSNVERISQGAAISYFQSLANKPVYVGVYGYKSYAPLFYSNVQPDVLFKQDNREHVLLHQPLLKPVYLLAKVPYNNVLDSLQFSEIGRLNGFVFLNKETAISP